jgi:hypothetical protein
MGRRSRELRERRRQCENEARLKDKGRIAGEWRGCLFCRQSDGGFTSREHVFSEGLGNDQIILPPGVVCDRCNNRYLSRLDQILVDFMPISIRRTMLGVETKAGVLPRFRFSEGTVEHVPGVGGADPTLIVNERGPRPMIREIQRSPDGKVKLEWKGSGGRRMTPRYAAELSNALLKTALECAWIDHGEMMLEARFDHVRQAVLGKPRDGFCALGLKLNPDRTQVALTYNLIDMGDGTWRMPVIADFFGVCLVTDSLLSKVDAEVSTEDASVISFSQNGKGAA